LRTRWATASRRGSAALADALEAPPDERLAPLVPRDRGRLLVPLLLLRVVRRVPLEPLPLDRLVPARDPAERREELDPDEPPELEPPELEPPELEPEPLLLAWGMLPPGWDGEWLGP
jgi:hypothetical protein